MNPLVIYRLLFVYLQITAEELTGNDDYIELSFSARKLDDKVTTTLCVCLCVCVLMFTKLNTLICPPGLSVSIVVW